MFRLLRRRWLPLFLCIVTGALASLLVTRSTPNSYDSSTTLIVTLPTASSPQEALQGVQLTSQLLQSYAAVATSRTSAEKVRSRLRLTDSPDAIRGKISASPDSSTLLITIRAVDGDPAQAQRIADATAAVLVESVAELESGKSSRVIARVLDPAQAASSPFSPQPRKNLAIGMLLGLVVGLALALVLDALDRTIKTAVQAAESLRVPLLGSIPKTRESELSPSRVADDTLSEVGEAYRALRTAVRFLDIDAPLRTILVTSAVEGEGKSTTAANLAVALAQSGDRVVLVDGDLRRGRIAAMMGLPDGVGVTTVVTHQLPLVDAMQTWRELMPVLGAGPLPPNPSEILGSRMMAELLEELCGFADVVVLDAPPVLPVTDAVILSTHVDGVVLVARAGRTGRSQAAEARRRLDGVGAKVVGCVLNGVSGPSSAGYYGNYRYLARPAERQRFGRRADDIRAS